MNLIACTTNVNPCPAGDQALLSFSDVIDYGALGVSSESMLQMFAWGFGAVFGFWLIGYVLSLAIGVVRKV